MLTNKKLLLIEDDEKKIEDVELFLKDEYSYETLVVKESYQSGLRELIINDYNLLLLDMSIPTWDKSPTESGGNFEKFGGYKILKEIVRKGKPLKTILITMFDDFGESDKSITLNQLDSVLKSEFSGFFIGSVFYNSQENNWQDVLKTLIKEI